MCIPCSTDAPICISNFVFDPKISKLPGTSPSNLCLIHHWHTSASAAPPASPSYYPCALFGTDSSSTPQEEWQSIQPEEKGESTTLSADPSQPGAPEPLVVAFLVVSRGSGLPLRVELVARRSSLCSATAMGSARKIRISAAKVLKLRYARTLRLNERSERWKVVFWPSSWRFPLLLQWV